MKGSWESYIEGPRWQLPEDTIQKMIVDSRCGLTLEYERRSTTWFTATILFKISGEESALRAFQDVVAKAVEASS
jgi:hypothetical protein